MKTIKDWNDLSKIPQNDNFRIVVDTDMCSGHLETVDGYYLTYLTTHTFYTKERCKTISKLLQRCGFDVELETWDLYKRDE